MKKIYCHIFGVCMTTAALFSCSDKITVADDLPTEEESYALFSVRNDADDPMSTMKRTSADETKKFYWSAKDHIWVLGDDNKYHHSHKAQIEAGNRIGHFLVHGQYTKPSYKVFYAGQNSPSAPPASPGLNESVTKEQLLVTIPAAQTQKSVNNADHFAVSGDCGTAIATYGGSTQSYSFDLKHKAAYLMIYPYKDASVKDKHFILDRITIEDMTDVSPLTGQFKFDVVEEKDTITLHDNGGKVLTFHCGEKETGFPVPETAAMASNGSYAVINPGQHQLKITYHVYDVNHNYEAITKNLPNYTFKANGFSTVHHRLTPNFPEETWYDLDIYFRWDAIKKSSGLAVAADIYEKQNEGAAPLEATHSCKFMPNANEMWWYVQNGDARWDDGTSDHKISVFKRKDSVTEQPIYETKILKGAWFKRKSVILNSPGKQCGHSSHNGNGPTFCSDHAAVMEGGVEKWVDLRTYVWPVRNQSEELTLASAAYQTGGRPTQNLEDYFYLPALGYLGIANGYPQPSVSNFEFTNVNQGYYWSSTALMEYETNGTVDRVNHAYYLHFDPQFIHVHGQQTRSMSCVAGEGWFH